MILNSDDATSGQRHLFALCLVSGRCRCQLIARQAPPYHLIEYGHKDYRQHRRGNHATDNTGADSYNMTLSKERAQAVTNYLTSHGLSAGRFTTKWYGETQPKYDNSTVEGRAKNRRVELAIVANEEMKEEAKQKAN